MAVRVSCEGDGREGAPAQVVPRSERPFGARLPAAATVAASTMPFVMGGPRLEVASEPDSDTSHIR